MTRLMKSQKGFTLLEAMVAFGILAVGMSALLSMITWSGKAGRLSDGQRHAALLGVNEIETIVGGVDRNDDFLTAQSVRSGQFLWSRTVTLDAPETGVARVLVTFSNTEFADRRQKSLGFVLLPPDDWQVSE